MSTEKMRKTPSLLHLVKLISDSPDNTARNILRMRDSAPQVRNFEARNYHIMLLKGMAPDKVFRQAELDRREAVRKTALETLPLLMEYVDSENPGWFRETGEFHFLAARDIFIPFKLLGIARVGKGIKGLLSQIWKNNSPNADQFNIWASVVYRGLIQQIPDIEDFHWLEMSVPKGAEKRELRLRSLSSARLLTEQELNDVRDHLEAAMLIVENTPRKPKRPKKQPNHDQPSFDFDNNEDP